jgi:hypothetical protein
MSWIRHLKHPNAALAAIVLFLIALIEAPNAMSAIRRSAAPVAQEDSVVVTPEETSITAPEVVGQSGNLRAVIGTPEALSGNTTFQSLLGSASLEPGVHPLDARAADGDSLVAVTMQPFDAAHTTRHDGYYTGSWSSRGLAATNPQYAPPQGYIRVTPENENTPVSERFRLADFLTHDQQAVWPKVLVLQPRILDKLELIGAELERRGLPSELHVMSGFRTPQYNEQGVGKKGGRAEASRHQYGDAADIYVDADGDQRMDDLNHDGRITVKDARVLFAVAEQVEAQHPELVGGLSAYSPTRAHGPFVHVDARGTRARW